MSEYGLTAEAMKLLNSVRSIFGAQNVIVTSGARSPSANARIPGASPTSQHIGGDAFDFRVTGRDPKDIQGVLAASGLSYGQSIAEYGLGMGPRNHLSVGTKNETLIANNGKYKPITLEGTKSYLDGIREWERSILKGLGLNEDQANVWTDPDASVTEVVAASVDWNGWFGRVAIGLFALIFIAAALFTFKGGGIISTAKGLVK